MTVAIDTLNYFNK